jgi:hypothetical protein
VSALDSGKPLVDAAFGEVIVTCEKIWWLVAHGEKYLRPEHRAPGVMVRLFRGLLSITAAVRCHGLRRCSLRPVWMGS